MTDKELISKLQLLKQITPSKEWAFSVKMQVLEQATAKQPVIATPTFQERLGGFVTALNQGKLAYSFAAFLLIAVGLMGAMQGSILPLADKSVAVLSPDFVVKSRVETLKAKSQNLASAVMSKEQETILVAVKEVKSATKELAVSIAQNPDTAKEVAQDIKENKTYLDIVGNNEELKETSDELYKTIDEQMILDLEKASLGEEQKVMLQEVKELFKKEKYAEALEKIFLINK